MKGIVKLDDGWAVFCCWCEKELTRGHETVRMAFRAFPAKDKESGLGLWALGTYKEHDNGASCRCYCSSTCKQAGEKRRDEMEEKGKTMWRVIRPDGATQYGDDGEKCEANTPEAAIEMVPSVAGASGHQLTNWVQLKAAGYLVESFTPTTEIDWEEVTFECMDQKNGWGNTDDCAFCNATKEHPKASFHCQKCPLQAYAESINVGNKFRRCVNLGIKKATAMGLTQNDKFSRHVFPSVLADFLVWYESGGMDKK